MTGTPSSRPLAFVRSVALLTVLVGGVPWALAAAARARFGGVSPLHGVPAPVDWDADRIRRSLTDRLTDDTIADVVVRSCLVVAWLAVLVLVVTIAVEVAHMIRHAGMPMPDVRGLAPTQRVARVIAVGLLALTPMLASPSRGIARDGGALVPPSGVDALGPEAVVPAARPTDVWAPGPTLPVPGGPAAGAVSVIATGSTTAGAPSAPSAPSAPDPASDPASATVYVVQPGDSIYAIAQRRVGPEPSAVVDYAERMIELNIGQPMVDGRRFTNAAFIDVGWVLRLPGGEAATSDATTSDATTSDATTSDATTSDAHGPAANAVHVVATGESLWSIAADELGDAERWREIHELNRDRVFADGWTLRDPDLIRPGWELRLPAHVAAPSVATGRADASPAAEVADAGGAADTAVGGVGGVGDVAEPPAEVAVEEVAGGEEADGLGTEVAFPEAASPARPANVWASGHQAPLAPPPLDARPAAGRQAPPALTPLDGAGSVRPLDHPIGASAPTDDRAPTGLLSLGGAAALASGVLTLLAVRRRQQLRRARPRARLLRPEPAVAAVERTLRGIDGGDRLVRVDVAVRHAAPVLARAGARVLVVLASPDGEIELRALGPVVLPAPWVSDGEPDRWRLPAAVPIELVATDSRHAVPPCPTLVQIGRTPDGRDVLTDLEALEALEIGGPGDQAEAIVRAIATSLSCSVLAEVTALVAVGVADEAFLGHRHHVVARDAATAFELAAEAIGSTGSADRSTFELRVAASAGETWEPAVVLAGASAGAFSPPRRRTGLAIVSASPIQGPSSRLVPAGDAWELLPAGIRVIPLGLSDRDIAGLAALVGRAGLDDPVILDAPDPDITIVDRTDDVRRPTSADLDEPTGGPTVEPTAGSRGPSTGEPADTPMVTSTAGSRGPSTGEPAVGSREEPADVPMVTSADESRATSIDESRVAAIDEPEGEPTDVSISERRRLSTDEAIDEPKGEPTDGPAGAPRDVAAAVPAEPWGGPLDVAASRVASDEHHVSAPTDDRGLPPSVDWRLVVRLFGGVEVVAPDGTRADFERSKAKELVAWLATHRERATRTAARTALWEQDVRDGTFANVVSEARRLLARLVEPPAGEEWVGRTMTEALPLHPLVRTDAELVEHALAVARVQPPDQAIATLAPAVEWIQGMPFEGTTYLWPDAEGITSHLVVLATSATAELAAHHLSIGDVDGVFRATARGLQVLPAHETLIGLRMQAHARAGDLAGVRHEWESYERVIVADPWSDGEPAPKLVELRRRLLHPSR